MCVISVLPIGTEISELEVKNMWDANDDGAGFMFVNPDTGNISVKKYMKYDAFKKSFFSTWNKYKEKTPFVLHFRIGTHGSLTIDNVHPFRVNDSVAFCHNGILTCVQVKDLRSDTRTFNDKFMQTLPHNFVNNKSIMNMIHELIGCTYNKFVFLTKDKQVVIINKKLGVESEGRWFSNGSFRSATGYGSYPYAYSSGYDWEDGPYWDEQYGGSNSQTKRLGGIEGTSQKYEWCNLCQEIVPPNDFEYFSYAVCKQCVKDFEKYPKKIERISNKKFIDIQMATGRWGIGMFSNASKEKERQAREDAWADMLKAKDNEYEDIYLKENPPVYRAPNPSTHSMTQDEWEKIKGSRRLNEKLGVGL